MSDNIESISLGSFEMILRINFQVKSKISPSWDFNNEGISLTKSGNIWLSSYHKIMTVIQL